jgi:hypothetical protein
VLSEEVQQLGALAAAAAAAIEDHPGKMQTDCPVVVCKDLLRRQKESATLLTSSRGLKIGSWPLNMAASISALPDEVLCQILGVLTLETVRDRREARARAARCLDSGSARRRPPAAHCPPACFCAHKNSPT